MKKTLSSLFLIGALAVVAREAQAVPCDASTQCELPASNSSQASWTPSASGMTAIQCSNSVGPTGNTSSAQYYFAASSTDQGATLAKGSLSTTGTGTEVIGSFSFASGSTPGSTVFGGAVQSLLGNQAYTMYVQACPSGQAFDSALCSIWARVGTRSTLAYPAGTTLFQAPVAPTDAAINRISYRTGVPTADLGNVSLIRLDIHDLINAANNQTLTPIGWTGSNGTFNITNAMYTQNGGFKPNVKYEYVGKVVYPYGVDVPATSGQQLRGPFWTTPATPANVVTSNITHCSVQIDADNSAGVPANPTYTPYRLCAGAVCAANIAIGGTGVPGDSVTRTITGLSPNTAYTPNATAIVGNGSDATASSWNNSSTASGTGFTTLNWGGTFSVTGITNNSATFNVSGIIGSGSITSWQILLNGSSTGQPSGVGAPPATIALNGLSPNVQYTVRIRLTETSGCFSDLPVAGITFRTTPNVPTTFALTAPTPFSLSATWSAASNPGTTPYQIEYCTDAAFTLNCLNQSVAAGQTSATIATGINPVTTYFAHVRAMTAGGGSNSAFSNSDSATTPADVSNITIAPTSASLATGNSQLFTATVKDPSGNVIPGQAVTWSVNGGGSLTANNGASTTFNATTPGSFTLTASLAGYPDATASITVVASGIQITQQPTLTLTTNNAGVVATNATDNVLGNASIIYTWTLQSGPSSINVSPNGTNASKNATVTFSGAGTYVLRCTYSNNGGTTFAVTNSTTVVPVLSGLTVSPTNITLKTLQQQVFTASGVDQFNNPMTPPAVTWSSSGGSISGAGAFSSSLSLGQNVIITARSGNLSGTANISVITFDVGSAFAFPVPYKSTQGNTITFRNIGNDAKIRVFTTAGREVFKTSVQSSTMEYVWDVKNMSGEKLASGVYFYIIESPDGKKNGKLIIIQ